MVLKLSNFEIFRTLQISKHESKGAPKVALFELIRAQKISINFIMRFKFMPEFFEKNESFNGKK